jgi:cytochrome c oxidase assembly factor CtaG
MHPLLQALFSAWEWRLTVTSVLLTFATLYIVGWWRLRGRSQHQKLAQKRRLVAYLAGVATLAIALMSPIDALGNQLLFMHMIQHKLEIMIAAPLLWLGQPFPMLLWGLPAAVRKRVAMLLTSHAPLRQVLRVATGPGIAWFAFVAVYMGWHDPGLYNLALVHSWAHDLQHITFFITAMLFWWHVIGAGPHLHGRVPVWTRLAMVVGMIPVQMIAGIVIATASTVIYTYYESVPRFWGFTALEDQALAGVIMWIPSSEMLVWAVVFLLAGFFKRAEPLAAISAAAWNREEALSAPGLEQRVGQKQWRQLAEARVQARNAS